MKRLLGCIAVSVPIAALLLAVAPFAAAEGPAPTGDDPAANAEAAGDAAGETAEAAGDTAGETDEAAKLLSYGIGHQVGRDFRRLDRPLDREALLAGLRDAMARVEARFTPAEMRAALRRLEEDRAAAER